MSEYTPGEIQYIPVHIAGGWRLFIGSQYIGFVGDSDQNTNAEQNARRLAACWNACEGITTETIEKKGLIPVSALEAQRDELLEALKDLREMYQDVCGRQTSKADEAIAKAEGGAS